MAVAIGFLGTARAGTLNNSFDLPDTDSKTATDLLAEIPGGAADAFNKPTATVVWRADTGTATDPAVAGALVPVLTEISQLDGVACVTNPYDPQGKGLGVDCPAPEQAPQLTPEQQAQLAPALEAAQKAYSPFSPDGLIAKSTITFSGAGDGSDVPAETAKTILDDVKALDATDGITVGATGQVLEFAGQEPPSQEAVGVMFALVILLIAFGSIIAAGLPLLTAVVGVGLGGLLLLFTANFKDVAVFAPTLAAMIGLGVGIDYSLFVINRYRQAVHAGREPRDAALEAVNTSGRAVVFAASTVIIALLGLFVMRINFFDGLALAASGTVLLVMLSAIWLLPALLSLLGKRAVEPLSGIIQHGLGHGGWKRVVAIVAMVVIWLWALGTAASTWGSDQFGTAAKVVVTLVALGAAALGTFGYRLTREHRHEREPWHPEGGRWAHYARFLQRVPWIPAILSLGIVLVLAIPALSLRLGFPDDSGKPQGSVARTAYDLTTEGWGAGANAQFLVAVELPKAGDLQSLGAVIGALEQTEGVQSVTPSTAMLPLAQQQLQGQSVAVVSLQPTTGPQEEATSELLERVRTETIPAVEQATGVQAYVGGFTAIVEDFTGVLRDALLPFLALVMGLGFLMLMVLFRAPVVSLTAVFTSLLSFFASLGVTVAVFQWGWLNGLLGVSGTGPIFPFLPVMVFAILFGLSMDYQVFLVSRMQEEWARTKDNVTAVRRGMAGSGRVVLMAALIMASVFGAFIPTPGNEIKLFGVALTSAVVVDAFLIRLVFIPSFMTILGKVNWWLPGWLDRILPHFEVEGSDEIGDDEPEALEGEPEPATTA
jgi:RND superfamily putative drug exporter